MRCTFANKFKVINIIDSAALKNIKVRLWSGNKLIILKFINKEDESKEGSGIDRENDSKNKKD